MEYLTEIADSLIRFNRFNDNRVPLPGEDIQGVDCERLMSDSVDFNDCHSMSVDRECVAITVNE